MLALTSPVGAISHIGRSVDAQLKHLGILTAKDLLFYFPARYDDLSKITPIREVKVGERAVVRGRIELLESTRSKWRRKLLTHAMVADATGSVRVVWFNQPWIAKMFKIGDELYLIGTLKDEGSGAYLASPVYERVSRKAAVHAARIVPVYPSTEKLSQKQIRFLIQRALPLARTVPDPLPTDLRAHHKLMPLPQALSVVHFPSDMVHLEAARRRLKFDELLSIQLFAATLKRELKRLPAPAVAFHEATTKHFVDSLPYKLTDAQRKAAWEILGDLTGRKTEDRRQKTDPSSVIRPPSSVHPMNRLLEGDVGSGKTVVVAIAALNAVLGTTQRHPERSPKGEVEGSHTVQGVGSLHSARASVEMTAIERGQIAIMAPTEILARQHFKTFTGMLTPQGVSVELRTSAEKGPKHIKADVVVGTHALIQKGVVFENLVLAVVDEQHRFGVEQRSALKEKRGDGMMPHLLSLTATPIPRSLALVFYGDLDISILDEMPKGRQRIETVLVADVPSPPTPLPQGEGGRRPGEGAMWSREQAYEFVRGQVKAGHQVFWTCPIIDPSDTLGVKAATEVFEHLRSDVFTDLNVGLLHGRMRPKEREKVMEKFVGRGEGLSFNGEKDSPSRIDILVATPVIEVGIDVPNATVMVIEGAERFGLAQLHQFRGRVGRGEAKSHCLLMVDTPFLSSRAPTQSRGEGSHTVQGVGSLHSPAVAGSVEMTSQRIQAFLESQDGFALAEKDLELRGPGEVYGTAQSGFPEFKIASFADVEIAKEAKEAAQWILAQDPELTRYPQLKAAILQKEGKTHLE